LLNKLAKKFPVPPLATSKAALFVELQKEILSLQGCPAAAPGPAHLAKLGAINKAFPHARFPVGALHEAFCTVPEESAATGGFLAGILSSLLSKGGAAIWITPRRIVFPPALNAFGIDPARVIFIEPKKERDVLWAMEEVLKCTGITAVIGEAPEISFTESRRFQLAMEKSGVTAFLIRRNPRNLATAAVARWKITPLPSVTEDGLPGLGSPRWKVDLLKVRNGKPGTWNLEWNADGFQPIRQTPHYIEPSIQKAS
jgi:protein ImuA